MAFCVPLKTDTGYEFCVMGKKGGSGTRWSEAVAVGTKERVMDEEIENVIRKFRANIRDADKCFNLFKVLGYISDKQDKDDQRE